jgi:phosphoribosyl-AMP cyclohydrolase
LEETLSMNSVKIFAERADKKQIEEENQLAPKFDRDGLIPVVTTDFASGEVLMVAYMNAEALQKTIEIGEAVYWSRSRQELWHKGATSGMTQKVREMRIDCDQDTILLRVEMIGGACCHVGYRSCFYRSIPVGDDAMKSGMEIPLPLTTLGEKVFDPQKVYGKK